MFEALFTFTALLVTWWCFRIYSFLRRLSEIEKPIPGIPLLPTDFLVDLEGEKRPWDWVLRLLGLPIRWLGFAYPFAFQDVSNVNLTGSDILLLAHSQFGPVLQFQAFGQHVVQIQDSCAAKTALANLDKDSSTTASGVSGVALLWNFWKDSLPRTLLVLASGEAHRQRRMLFKAAFHEAHIKTQYAIIAALMTKFAATFDAAAESGDTVLLSERFSVLTVEVICESVSPALTCPLSAQPSQPSRPSPSFLQAMCCDLSKLCDSRTNSDSFHETYAILSNDLAVMLKSFFLQMIPPLALLTYHFPSWLIPSAFLRQVKLSRARVDVVVEKIYNHIMGIPESCIEKDSFVAAIREFATWPDVTKFNVKMELTLFFLAGHETTANTCA